jgi:DNA replication protein DnaC
MNGTGQVKAALVENLRELHLRAMLARFEDTARQAEKETFSYEQYLLELSQRECEQRHGNRIRRRLQDSGLPLEKSLANSDVKRLPVKVSRQLKCCCKVASWIVKRICWRSGIRERARVTWCVPSHRS